MRSHCQIFRVVLKMSALVGFASLKRFHDPCGSFLIIRVVAVLFRSVPNAGRVVFEEVQREIVEAWVG